MSNETTTITTTDVLEAQRRGLCSATVDVPAGGWTFTLSGTFASDETTPERHQWKVAVGEHECSCGRRATDQLVRDIDVERSSVVVGLDPCDTSLLTYARWYQSAAGSTARKYHPIYGWCHYGAPVIFNWQPPSSAAAPPPDDAAIVAAYEQVQRNESAQKFVYSHIWVVDRFVPMTEVRAAWSRELRRRRDESLERERNRVRVQVQDEGECDV